MWTTIQSEVVKNFRTLHLFPIDVRSHNCDPYPFVNHSWVIMCVLRLEWLNEHIFMSLWFSFYHALIFRSFTLFSTDDVIRRLKIKSTNCGYFFRYECIINYLLNIFQLLSNKKKGLRKFSNDLRSLMLLMMINVFVREFLVNSVPYPQEQF